MMKGKMCIKCGDWKEYSEFGKAKANKDGYTGQCKLCIREYNRGYRKDNKERIKGLHDNWRENNKDRVKEYSKESTRKWRENNKEHLAEYYQRYHQENKEHRNKYNQQYYQDNKEYFKEYAQQLRKENPEKYREYVRDRRSHEGHKSLHYGKRLKIIERDNYTCQHCGITVRYDKVDWWTEDYGNVDHIVPLERGGNSEDSNLQCLCRVCNDRKKDSLESELDYPLWKNLK